MVVFFVRGRLLHISVFNYWKSFKHYLTHRFHLLYLECACFCPSFGGFWFLLGSGVLCFLGFGVLCLGWVLACLVSACEFEPRSGLRFFVGLF